METYTDAGENIWLDPASALFGSDKASAEFYGVSLKTIRKWKKTGTAPLMAIRLMRLRMDGDLSALGGTAWRDFRFGRDGKIYLPGWAHGWNPDEIRALFFTRQELRHWKTESARLERELMVLKEKVWADGKLLRLGLLTRRICATGEARRR